MGCFTGGECTVRENGHKVTDYRWKLENRRRNDGQGAKPPANLEENGCRGRKNKMSSPERQWQR